MRGREHLDHLSASRVTLDCFSPSVSFICLSLNSLIVLNAALVVGPYVVVGDDVPAMNNDEDIPQSGPAFVFWQFYLQLPWYQYRSPSSQRSFLHFFLLIIFLGQGLPPSVGLTRT